MRISVITVCYNAARELTQTIESVLNQTYPNLTYWVIDGKSTDDTVEVLSKYSSRISFVSEADTGIYNAMNKAIYYATGDYLIFLNAGDYFKDHTVLEYLIQQSSGEDIVFGDIVYKNDESETTANYPDQLSFEFFLKDTIPHPCALIKRSLFFRYGLYNEALKICADWAFFLDVVVRFNSTYKHVNGPISVFRLGGLSSRPENAPLIKHEKESYLDLEYSFLFKEYTNLNSYKERIEILRRSRIINFVLRFLPKRFRSTVFD